MTGGKVTNVKKVSGGNGYNNTDVLGITDVHNKGNSPLDGDFNIGGEQLVKQFIPSTATYTPASGDMVLTIGAGLVYQHLQHIHQHLQHTILILV